MTRNPLLPSIADVLWAGAVVIVLAIVVIGVLVWVQRRRR